MSRFDPTAKLSTRTWPKLQDWHIAKIAAMPLRERRIPFSPSANGDRVAAHFLTGLYPDCAFRYWKMEFGLDKEQPRKRPASPADDERQNKRPRPEAPATEAAQMASTENCKPAHPTGSVQSSEPQLPKNTSRPLTLRFNNSNTLTRAHTTNLALENPSKDPPQPNTEGPHPQDDDLIGPIDDNEQIPTLKVEDVDEEMKFLFE